MGDEGDAQRAEVGGAGLVRGPAEHVFLEKDPEAGQAHGLDDRFELCFQQSAGDSSGPE